MGFDLMQPVEQGGRIERSRKQRGGIGIAPPPRSDCKAPDDRRNGEDVDFTGFERGDGLLDNLRWSANMRQTLVGTKRDQVEMIAQISSTSRP